MDVDQPNQQQQQGNGPDYVYFERHPERFESARQKSTGVRMRLELWYKEGVEGAVERRERSVWIPFLQLVGQNIRWIC